MTPIPLITHHQSAIANFDFPCTTRRLPIPNRTLLDRDPDMDISPAALKPAAALPGSVISLTANKVLSRGAESSSSRSLPIGIDNRSLVATLHATRSPVFAPKQSNPA